MLAPVVCVWKYASVAPPARARPVANVAASTKPRYNVALAIQQGRLRSGMTQHQLGTLTNCGHHAIRRSECGNAAPTLDDIKQIESVLGARLLPS